MEPIWVVDEQKTYTGPMYEQNVLNVQILTIWVPYRHVCWDRNGVAKSHADELARVQNDMSSPVVS